MNCSKLKAVFLAVVVSMACVSAGHARDITLQWNANTETTLAGYKVYYRADSSALPFTGTGSGQGASPVNVAKQTSATLTGLDPAKSYYFAITAYNSAGTESTYSNIVSVAEGIAPTVSITAPTANSTATGTVSVTASATDNVGVTKVEYYVNGALALTDTTTPYVYSWNTTALANGSYTLMAKAYDAAGNVGQSANVVVSVAKDTVAPTTSLTAPLNNTTVSGSVVIRASASDNIGVSKVEFYDNGVLLNATNVSPYAYTWNTALAANGSHTLTVKAYDAVGNVGQSATGVTVTVNNISTVDTTAPVVTAFTMPATSTTVLVPITSFTATDNKGVSAYCVTSTNSTAYCDWVSTPNTQFRFASEGVKTAYGWTKDAAGNVSASRSATVTINSTPTPTVDTTPPAVTAFSFPATSTTLTVPITAFTATDNKGVSSYCVTSTNSTAYCDWVATPNTSFTFGSTGIKTAYAWAKDAAGYISASKSATVTIGAATVTPATYSLWSNTTVPSIVDAGADSSVELGIKFRSDVSGSITGIRFYKANTNTGTHTAALWSASGQKLATATFVNETASGWQQVNFSTPVAISANTTYVASYHANTGHYSFNSGALAARTIDNAPLHALAEGGVYSYGATAVFPTQTYESGHYWVDVVFKK